MGAGCSHKELVWGPGAMDRRERSHIVCHICCGIVEVRVSKHDKRIVGENPSRRKRRLRVLSAIGGHKRRSDKTYWLGMHQNNNCHARQEPSLAPIHMRVVDWDVRPRR